MSEVYSIDIMETKKYIERHANDIAWIKSSLTALSAINNKTIGVVDQASEQALDPLVTCYNGLEYLLYICPSEGNDIPDSCILHVQVEELPGGLGTYIKEISGDLYVPVANVGVNEVRAYIYPKEIYGGDDKWTEDAQVMTSMRIITSILSAKINTIASNRLINTDGWIEAFNRNKAKYDNYIGSEQYKRDIERLKMK